MLTQPQIFQQSTDQQPSTQRKEGFVADSRGASSLGPRFIDTEDKLTFSRIKFATEEKRTASLLQKRHRYGLFSKLFFLILGDFIKDHSERKDILF